MNKFIEQIEQMYRIFKKKKIYIYIYINIIIKNIILLYLNICIYLKR